MDKTFRYTGPASAITLRVAQQGEAPKDLEVVLWPNKTYSLPAEHQAVLVLVEQGHLVEVVEQPKAAMVRATGAKARQQEKE